MLKKVLQADIASGSSTRHPTARMGMEMLRVLAKEEAGEA
jgi:hypothetical protein